MLTFDHLKLVRRDPRELQRLRSYLMQARPGEPLPDINILHEHNNSCCRREPWNVTLTTVVKAVKPPSKLVAINLPMGM
jgi:hypothetical protein